MSAMEMDQFDLFGMARQEQPGAGLQQITPLTDDLPDAEARRRIREDLDTSMLVEAGAGAGKTTEMVRRMVALVASGRAQVQEVAAVTFTRKAASELRERFQTSLEQALRDARAREDALTAARIDRSLRDIDRAFLGTIHAFCARLLRERPLEAGLDPGFREMLGSEEKRERAAFWNRYIERITLDADAGLEQLRAAGIHTRQVFTLFTELSEHPDVEFPTEPRLPPAVTLLRRQVEDAMDAASSIAIGGRRDQLQSTFSMLRYHRFVAGWQDDARFLDTLARIGRDSFQVNAAAWTDAEAARGIRRTLESLFSPDGAATIALQEWREYRYPLIIAFARAAEQEYRRERVRNGTLNFQDLLVHAAFLLKSSPGARRDLGERYRYLLVDEFQDTDPVQAEVLFLLTSSSVTGEDADWRRAVPRAGALFVVGDPRQSIYRFRRADMSLYAQVRARFAHWGAVVNLSANFRSGAPLERFVNDNFITRFPSESTEDQAQFAPLHAQPRAADHPAQGVYWYDAGDPEATMTDLARKEAVRLAEWIRSRIDTGERKAGDFLLLTRNTTRLATYAAALEALNIPSQVTGARLVEKEELRELRLLMRAIADPGDATLTVAVLTGLFHGIDFEQLLVHAEQHDGNTFSFTRLWPEPHSQVTAALTRLRQYWLWSRDMPADIAVPRIVRDVGLLPYAATGNLGRTRAGALLYAMDAIRRHAIEGDSSINGAIAALDAALEESDSEAPLEPGRSDVVRVMNLHKAKGLEAPVVILAHPFEMPPRQPHLRIERQPDGSARGYVQVTEPGARFQVNVIAQPRGWQDHVATEQRYQAAENERVLYVAATRAADELVVGTMVKRHKPSPWRTFHQWLRDHGTRITLADPVIEPRPLLASGAALLTASTVADQARAAMRAPTYRAAAVTARKAPAATPEAVTSEAQVRAPYRVDGTTWGTVLHDALEQLGRGMSGTELRELCRGLLTAAERPVDEHGAPTELDELLALIDAVTDSELWQRGLRADIRLVEVPFGLRLTAEAYHAIGGQAAAPVEIVDGRIDLAFRENGAWTIVDYKSDSAGSRIAADVLDRYRAQVRLYGDAFASITGEPVAERALLFAADGVIVAC